MQDDFIALLGRKLDEALRSVDLRVADQFQSIYAQITPGPSCPYSSVLVKDINKICTAGLRERGAVAKTVVIGLLDTVSLPISADLRDKIISCVKQKLPEDQYVVQGSNIEGVYERRASGSRKFDERSFNLEMSAISCGSANLSRQAVCAIITALEERQLKARAESQAINSVVSPQGAESGKRERKPWTRDHRLSLMNIFVAIVAAVLGAVGIAATLYPEEMKWVFHSLGR